MPLSSVMFIPRYTLTLWNGPWFSANSVSLFISFLSIFNISFFLQWPLAQFSSRFPNNFTDTFETRFCIKYVFSVGWYFYRFLRLSSIFYFIKPLTTYTNATLNNNGDRTSSCLSPNTIWNVSVVIPLILTRALEFPTYAFIRTIRLWGNLNVCIIVYRLSRCTLSYAVWSLQTTERFWRHTSISFPLSV